MLKNGRTTKSEEKRKERHFLQKWKRYPLTGLEPGSSACASDALPLDLPELVHTLLPLRRLERKSNICTCTGMSRKKIKLLCSNASQFYVWCFWTSTNLHDSQRCQTCYVMCWCPRNPPFHGHLDLALLLLPTQLPMDLPHLVLFFFCALIVWKCGCWPQSGLGFFLLTFGL